MRPPTILLVDDEATLRAMADCGINLVAFVPPEALDICQRLGIKAIVHSDDVAVRWDKPFDPVRAANALPGLIRQVNGHPAVFGYHLKDEPDPGQFADLSKAVALVKAALQKGPAGTYAIQAAIAALHAEARTAADTDWPQVDALYRMLADLTPGPMVTLNHAVAVAEVDGPDAALAMLEPLRDDRRLRHHHRLHAVRAHLLDRAGRPAEAREEYAEAARLATSIPEQRYLNTKATG